jgi:type I restriction enzyme R subunit
VVLVRELDKALAKLNPKLAATSAGRDKLLQARDLLLDTDPTKTLLQHNAEKWTFIRDGITLKSPIGVAVEDVHIRVIDFEQPWEMILS